MQLSTEAELEHLCAIPDEELRVREGSSTTIDREVAPDASNAANPPSADSEGIAGHFPDETTLDDYPAAHIPDPGNDEGLTEFDHHESDDPHFDRNNIKADAFHFHHGYMRTLKKKHAMYEMFSGLLRDALFMPNPEDMQREEHLLFETLFHDKSSRCHGDRGATEREVKRRLYCPSSKVLENVRRHVPEPKTLLNFLVKVVQTCANVKDAKVSVKSSVPLCIVYIT
ncbi:MAG: hypothetical protein ACRDL7_01160, partial [Gaiellaceae bacterium]